MKTKGTLVSIALLAVLALSAQDQAQHTPSDFLANYTQAAEQAPMEAEMVELELKRKLAYHYLRAFELEQSERYFSELVVHDHVATIDILSYASVLRMNDKWEESHDWMKVYAVMSPDDEIGWAYGQKEKDRVEIYGNQDQFQITRLDINSPEEDFGANYFGDKLIFASSRITDKVVARKSRGKMPFLDLYVSSISDGHALTEPEPYGHNVNKKFHDGPICFNREGDHKIITRNNYESTDENGIRKLKMYESRMTNGEWSEPIGLPWNSDEYSSGHASLSQDGMTMVFVMDREGGYGGTDLYTSRYHEDGYWTEPRNLGPNVNTKQNEMFPFVHDSRVLTFASNGHVGLGGLDVFYTKLNEDGTARKIKNVGAPINSPEDDFAMIFNEDMSRGYFSSNREGGAGSDDIYSFDMTPFEFCTEIEGIARDASGETLRNVDVTVMDNDGVVLETLKADKDGQFNICLAQESEFVIMTSKRDYQKQLLAIETKEDDNQNVEFFMHKDAKLMISELLTEAGSTEPVGNVKISFNEYDMSETIDDLQMDKKERRARDRQAGLSSDTLEGGSLKVTDYTARGTNAEDADMAFDIVIEKEGYLPKHLTYVGDINTADRNALLAELDLTMTKIEEAEDISEAIGLAPIYFDVDDDQIRPDAAAELKKVISMLNTYPEMEIEVGAHTDCRAVGKYNRRLSEKRAKRTMKWIRERIENPSRVSAKGYGEDFILNDCKCGFTDENNQICSEEEHALNRRTEFKVIKM